MIEKEDFLAGDYQRAKQLEDTYFYAMKQVLRSELNEDKGQADCYRRVANLFLNQLKSLKRKKPEQEGTVVITHILQFERRQRI